MTPITPHPPGRARRAFEGWRWLPFATAVFVSNLLAARSPQGRKPFHFDWGLTLDALVFSATKGPHIGATALLGLMAMAATGRRHWRWALLLTVVAAFGWELGQTTVVDRTARLSDLLPDVLGALAGCAWGASVAWLLDHGMASLGHPPPARPTAPAEDQVAVTTNFSS